MFYKMKFLLVMGSLLVWMMISSFQSSAQDFNFIHGMVMDSIPVKTSMDTNYSLYLPSNYNASKKWPLLYVFEPAARGKLGVEVFDKYAEKYGYIVVCSNNSRNGPFMDNYAVLELTLESLQYRLSIDMDRFYVTGFSGGSRTAVSFAVLNPICGGSYWMWCWTSPECSFVP
jgi:predicted peptidase